VRPTPLKMREFRRKKMEFRRKMREFRRSSQSIGEF
jgi:hypothetical protein